MAVTINTYFSERIIEGSRPSVPSVPSSEIPPVVNPPGYPSGHSPVTLASPSNGLTLVGQELGLGLASSGVTGALSGTDWNTFNGKIGGSIASGQVAFGTGAGTIGGDSGLTWDNVNKRLGLLNLSPQRALHINSAGALRMINGESGIDIVQFNPTDWGFLKVGTTANFIMAPLNLGVNTFATPTNTLDVNGTARIRTINNLGTSATVLLTKSATGVISERTLAEFKSDIDVVGGEGIFLNSKVIGGTKRLIENSDILEIPLYWQYRVTNLDVDGIINNEGEIIVA